jgi:hypothetical protein
MHCLNSENACVNMHGRLTHVTVQIAGCTCKYSSRVLEGISGIKKFERRSSTFYARLAAVSFPGIREGAYM